MNHRESHLGPFLRALHARLVLVRVLERTGVGVLVGAASGALLIPLLLWTDRAAFVPVLSVLALGCVGGLIWGITRRPSALHAAMEADRQLGLADLLSTALSVGGASATDPWSRTVVAIADDRCRRHTPSEVLLNRLGSRAWGGIGLATALALTLAALSSAPGELRAGAAAGGSSTGVRAAPFRGAPDDRPLPNAARAPRSAAPMPSPEEADRHARRGPSDAGPNDQGGRDTAAPPDPATNHSTAAGDQGRGSGAGTSTKPRATLAPPINPPSGASTANPPKGTGPRTFAGGAAATSPTDDGAGDRDSPGSTAGAARAPRDRTPPWQSPSWPADARAARQAIDAGRVPDAYRDLVRDYFDRP
jgi:hypothetical protein